VREGRDALASIGVDLDAVRARIEATFGAEALSRAGQLVQGATRVRPRRGVPARLARVIRRRRRTGPRSPRLSPPPATGKYHAPGVGPGGHIPFTPRAKKILERALREALARNDSHIGAEHIALAVTSENAGLVPPILAALDAPPPKLRAAIEDRCRKAS